MDVQLLRQTIFLKDQLEPPGEGAWCHWIVCAMFAKHEVIFCQLEIFICIRLPDAFPVVLLQQACHLRREVHVAVSGGSFGALCKNIFSSKFDHVALDMNRVVLVVDVLPFQAATFTVNAGAILYFFAEQGMTKNGG